MNSNTAKQPAVLLLGPTGSGKTPLGDLIEQRGLWQSACLHFDFGANLRRIAAEDFPNDRFTRDEVDFLRRVLQSGALLEDEHFPLAARILESFMIERGAGPGTVVVLNGLPRHVGQARAMDAAVDMRAVVCLHCPIEVTQRRIRSNTGGDRTGRNDDDPEAIRNKLELYHRRTTPLVEHYQSRQVPLFSIDVTPTMSPDTMWRALNALG